MTSDPTVPPAKPRAFLVLAPESHGGHLVADVLANAGCLGGSGDHGPWYPEDTELGEGADKPWERELPADRQLWDNQPPSGEDPIVWRRSVPHQGKWIDIETMVAGLSETGYEVTAVVATRDLYAGVRSQLKWHHAPDVETARTNIARAYGHIFGHLERSDCRLVVVSYESLVAHPAAQDRLLELLDLEAPAPRLATWDGNRKWYEDRSSQSDATAPGPRLEAASSGTFEEP